VAVEPPTFSQVPPFPQPARTAQSGTAQAQRNTRQIQFDKFPLIGLFTFASRKFKINRLVETRLSATKHLQEMTHKWPNKTDCYSRRIFFP
jgi:chromosome condensin MukBEF ATPase and DNA-binding subunit MukB